MARSLRLEYPGAVYQVMARGNQGQPIFRDDRDRRGFLETIAEAHGKTGWRRGSLVTDPLWICASLAPCQAPKFRHPLVKVIYGRARGFAGPGQTQLNRQGIRKETGCGRRIGNLIRPGDHFPLTPARSLGERGNFCPAQHLAGRMGLSND